MTHSRRSFLSSLLALLLSWLPTLGRTRPAASKPETTSPLDVAIAMETGGQHPTENELIKLEVPDLAEDGSIVPISIGTEMTNVDSIWVFVEKNPTPLAARFDLDKSLEPFVSLRIKMNESCNVIAMVKSGNDYYSAKKFVRVVLGGCG